MSNPIQRHPDAVTLMSFAAGSLAEPLAAVVAAHAAMCGTCRAGLADLERLGAALVLNSRGGTAVASPHKSGRTNADAAGAGPHRNQADPTDKLPGPIAAVYGLTFDTIPWKRLGPGVWHHRLSLSSGVAGDLRLLRIAPGCRMPDHGHGGSELTLVLDGAYGDETGRYCRGEMQDVDEGTEHSPVADIDTGCVCLIASERPARFKGLVGRILQPFTGM